DVDAARDLEERHLIAEPLRRQIAERVPALAQHGDRRMHVALLADIESPLQRQARGVHDAVVVRWAGRDTPPAPRPALGDVQRPGAVAALASDAGRQGGVFAFEERDGPRVAAVTGETAVGQHAVEAGVVDLVAGAEVPAVL